MKCNVNLLLQNLLKKINHNNTNWMCYSGFFFVKFSCSSSIYRAWVYSFITGFITGWQEILHIKHGIYSSDRNTTK